MSESLRDQLLSAGFAKPVKTKAKSNKRSKPTNNASKQKSDLEQAWAARNHAEKSDKLQKREQKKAEQRRRQEINQKIFMLVDPVKLNIPDAVLARNFLHHGKIRKVMVDEKQLGNLNSGELAVVFLRGRYFLVKAETATEVADLSPYHVPDLKGVVDAEEAEHPVPDDLSW